MLDLATLGLRLDASQVREGDRALDQLGETAERTERQVDRTNTALDRLTKMAKAVAGAIAAMEIYEHIKEVTLLASRYNELGIVMGVVGKNAGYNSAQLAATELELRKTGISALQSRDAIAKLISANINLSNATKLARVAQDAAVIGGLNSSEAFASLVKGIQSAEKETLQTLGLNVNFTKSYDKMAKSLGKTADDLTEIEKTQAAVNAVMELAPGIAGAYEGSLTNAGKQMRSMSRYIEDLKVQLGQPFQNPFEDIVNGATVGLKFLSENVDTIRAIMQATINMFGPAAKIAAAYFAIFVAAPAILTAVWAAMTRVGHAVAVYAMNVMIGQANTIKFNTVLFGTSVAADLAAGSLTRAQLAANLLFAAFAGWQIGSYLNEQFVEARIAGEIMANGLAKGWESVKFAAQMMWEAIKFAGQGALDQLRSGFADFLSTTAKGLRMLGASESADSLAGYADTLRSAGSASGTFAEQTAGIREQYERTLEVLDAYTEKQIGSIMVAEKVSEATRGVAGAAVVAAEAEKGSSKEREKAIKTADDFIKAQRQELEEIGKNEEQLRILTATRAAAVAPLERQRKAIMENAQAINLELRAYAARKAAESAATEDSRAMLDLNERAAALELEVRLYGATEAAATRAEAAKLRATAGSLAISEEYREKLLGQVEVLERIAQLQGLKSDLDELFATDKVQSFGDALRDAFGGAGDGLSKLANEVQDYFDKEDAAEKARAKAKLKYGDDDKKLAKAVGKINAQQERDRISAYASMAGAAKTFFKEKTAGYKLLEAAERGFRLYELAMNAQVLFAKVSATTAATTAGVAGNAAVAASSVSSAATQVGANMAVGASAAAAGVANQAKGDPITAFARMAAMAAIMAALGFAVSGGGGSGPSENSAEVVQKRQGTGGVFGDDDAKSASISNSLELLEENSDLMLPLTQNMLSSLRGIESAMGGLANIALRTTGITTGENFDIPTGVVAKALGGLWGKTKQEITDAGLMFGGRVGNLQNGQGFSQYANVQTTKSSFFGLKKKTSDKLTTSALDAEVAEQFGMVFQNLETVLKSAATGLGADSNAVAQTVQNFILDTTKLSLKDLKGDELQDAINAVLSKATDDIAAAALPGFDDFRKVGEGYAETVIRVASGVEVAGLQLERFNITAIKYADITNKQGDVAAEIVRQSILAVNGVGGVAEIMRTLSGSASELADTYGELLAAQNQMQMVGMDPSRLDASLIRSAGGLDALQGGLDAYFEGFFTEAEQVAAKTEQMRAKFAELGVAMPASTEAFRALVESSPALTGQLLLLAGGFAELMESSGSAAQIAEQRASLEIDLLRAQGNEAAAVAAERAIELAAMDASLRPLQERVWAIQDEAEAAEKLKDALRDAANDSIKALQRAVNAEKEIKVKAYNETMKGYETAIEASRAKISKLSGLSQSLESSRDQVGLPGVNRAGAQAALQRMLAVARAGGVGTLDEKELQRTLSALAQDSSGEFSSGREYEADRLQTAIAVGDLADITDNALTVEQRSLYQLETMRDQAKVAHEAELARLDGLVSNSQLQLDALLGVDTSVQSVEAALGRFSSLMASISSAMSQVAAGSQAAPASSRDLGAMAIGDLYQKVLGRQADAAGLAFWNEQLTKNGATLAAIEASMRASEEYAEKAANEGSRSLVMQGSSARVASADNGSAGTAEIVKAVDTMRSELKGVMVTVASYAQRSAVSNEDMERRERQKADEVKA